jgi:hypothetical protein
MQMIVEPRSHPESTKWDIEAVAAQLSFLQGEVLTVIDAVLPPGAQLKAVKDLVKGAFRNREANMRDLGEGAAKSGLNLYANGAVVTGPMDSATVHLPARHDVSYRDVALNQ